MKTLKKLNKRSVFATFTLALMVAFVLGSFTPVFADEPSVTPPTINNDASNAGGTLENNNASSGGGNYSVDELGETATTTLSNVQANLVKVCLAIFPVSLIICLAVLFFTHDERKIATTAKICVTVCVVCLLIILVNGGVFLDMIQSFANSLQK